LLPRGFRADIVVADVILLEVKGVAALLPVHDAQGPHASPRQPDPGSAC
jgi:hypothetical protein